jgi:lipopolysaccharide cholinephosphotransferase
MIQSMIFCCFNFQRLPYHKSRLTYYATKAALTVVHSDKLRYRLWKSAEEQVAKYGVKDHPLVASFGEGVSIMRQRFPKEWFLEPGTAVFEGHPMPVPADTDRYLTISYGDYMQLPPPEEQVPRHDTVFMDLEHSYKQYRGIKYFVEGAKKEKK